MWKNITEPDVNEFSDIAKISDFPCGNDTTNRIIHSLRNKIGCELFIYEGEKFTIIIGLKYVPHKDIYRFLYSSTDFRGVEDIELYRESARIVGKFIYDFLKKKDKTAYVIRLEGKLIPKNKRWIINYTEEAEAGLRDAGVIVEKEGIYWVFKWRQGL